MDEQADEVLVVHSLREAGRVFGGRSPDTMRQWALSNRLDATQEASGRWTIRIPPDHPDLPSNRADAPTHYPRLEDERDLAIARLEAELAAVTSERDFLREQQLAWQRTLPQLAERLVTQLRPPALPAPPVEKPWWWWAWPWRYAR